ncbi:MAG: hypothetical protein K0Q59_3286 [Paenibacillus sp.]|jgi:hypothetical protein|nr:hypothetical protein [Paenibacillus sp.]
MSVLQHIASMQQRNDEEPNMELARRLAASEDAEAIREIAEHVNVRDKHIQSDCIKVLYEIGAIKPQLIADYAESFIQLLQHKNNRLVWGAMTALAAVAKLKADVLYNHRQAIFDAIENGSVITIDNGIKVLAGVASADMTYNAALFPYLLNHLKHCRSKEVGQHAESIVAAVNPLNQAAFADALKEREASLTSAQLARVKKLYEQL